MSGRTLVVIVFFWAALTIITPMLVLLSESSKPNSELNIGLKGEGIKDRKLIGYGVKQVISNEIMSSTDQLEAAAAAAAAKSTHEQQNGSWLQELETCVNHVFRRAIGLVVKLS